jgi:2-dehydropantoate 2-reductase
VRFVVFGAGAIGGVAGAGLHQAGYEVALIARGEHYRAIRDRGLTFERPGESVTLEIPVADSPAALEWDGEEVVLIATKSQDTAGAVSDLRASAPISTPVVCLQNGVENERTALRLMPNVYGAVVMMPTAHLDPGVVQAYGTRGLGVIDVGRYPSGTDPVGEEVAAAFSDAGISSKARPDIMRFKYAKLINNLLNAVDAIVEPGPAGQELIRLAQEEGRTALTAAGIEFVAEEVNDVQARWQRLDVQPIAGRPRAGSSTRQSLARGAPSLETDYLNGEISLIGRLHGVPTPVNDALCVLSERHLRERRPPQTLPPEEVLGLARARHYADGPVRR